MSIVEAEADLLSNRVFKTTFLKYTINVLNVLCTRYNITVTPTGRRSSPLKRDYVNALNTYAVRGCVRLNFRQLSTYQKTHSPRARRPEHQVLEVHWVEGAKDWVVLRKVPYQWRMGEDIDLVALAGRFGETHKLCHVGDPFAACFHLSITSFNR